MRACVCVCVCVCGRGEARKSVGNVLASLHWHAATKTRLQHICVDDAEGNRNVELSHAQSARSCKLADQSRAHRNLTISLRLRKVFCMFRCKETTPPRSFRSANQISASFLAEGSPNIFVFANSNVQQLHRPRECLQQGLHTPSHTIFFPDGRKQIPRPTATKVGKVPG